MILIGINIAKLTPKISTMVEFAKYNMALQSAVSAASSVALGWSVSSERLIAPGRHLWPPSIPASFSPPHSLPPSLLSSPLLSFLLSPPSSCLHHLVGILSYYWSDSDSCVSHFAWQADCLKRASVLPRSKVLSLLRTMRLSGGASRWEDLRSVSETRLPAELKAHRKEMTTNNYKEAKEKRWKSLTSSGGSTLLYASLFTLSLSYSQ